MWGYDLHSGGQKFPDSCRETLDHLKTYIWYSCSAFSGQSFCHVENPKSMRYAKRLPTVGQGMQSPFPEQ